MIMVQMANGVKELLTLLVVRKGSRTKGLTRGKDMIPVASDPRRMKGVFSWGQYGEQGVAVSYQRAIHGSLKVD